MMDAIIHTFLDLVAPPFTFFTLLFVLPPLRIFKFFLSILGALFTEDVAGKVVLITGASSGIGESVAYEYAKRGACLVLAARREKSLEEVGERALYLGSPEVLAVRADVADPDDCRSLVDRAINAFGRLDHLVNNAGIMSVAMLDQVHDVTDFREIMDINFWGSVYMTRFAAPYLRASGGRIVAVSSAGAWLPSPRMSFYNASKAALFQFYETLRVEFGGDIGITLVTPGIIESELTQGKYFTSQGRLVVDKHIRDVEVSLTPIESVERCAKAIVKSAVRGEAYLTEPAWFRTTFFWKVFFPELVEWLYRVMCVSGGAIDGNEDDEVEEPLGKRVLDYTGAKSVLYPDSLDATDPKTD
ncbi:11-beta-hydroxysteroid dehydrogenase A-like [Andrographis paniculata]|uniref:11-beta-hydroxysteroid dehydrogenase A-like n=1 Tax=Andrographis paniculata TaxID=175694 RepID=UPI0021E8BA87|nr:11-beta-hydroxysteroid dehydrogenase A-like [Andrographis paniculata]